MGSWIEAVYTKEQQERLGVDAQGHKIKPAVHTSLDVVTAGDTLLQPQPEEPKVKEWLKQVGLLGTWWRNPKTGSSGERYTTPAP